MKVSLAFHVISLILWLGSLMIITRCMKIFSREFPKEAEEGLSGLRQTIKKLFYGFCLPGSIIALISGIYQISYRGAAYYMSQGWFHTKLTLVVILYIVTFLVMKEVKNISAGKTVPGKKSTIFHAVSSACMLIIIFLTILNI